MLFAERKGENRKANGGGHVAGSLSPADDHKQQHQPRAPHQADATQRQQYQPHDESPSTSVPLPRDDGVGAVKFRAALGASRRGRQAMQVVTAMQALMNTA